MYKKVLVPLDGSELAECALDHVKDMFKHGIAGEILVLNVFCPYIPPIAEGETGSYVNVAEFKKRAGNDSKKYLDRVESQLASEGIKVKAVSLEGERAADAISTYARERGVDLIVLASHGYTGLKKLMFGSVALELLHDSHVPVLLIRPETCRT
ncbi:MAG: Universal stress protein family protein [Smithella sp. PtaU1.Bin162]|nr:MAG: Universal stress protein family protein [Smithella sp. PtaU1.Bin162]